MALRVAHLLLEQSYSQDRCLRNSGGIDGGVSLLAGLAVLCTFGINAMYSIWGTLVT